MSDERSKFAVLLSGGKDSNYAILLNKRKTGKMPCCAITVKAKEDDMLFHYENVKWAELQCRSMGLSWIFVDELEEGLKEAREKYGADSLLTGGILSNFQKKRFESLAAKFGMSVYSPLWGVDQEEYMTQLVKDGIEYIIVKVAALGLGKEWLGRKIGMKETVELLELSRKYRFNPSFEGGEAETFVLRSPLYSRGITIKQYEVIWKKDSGVYLIKEAALE
ncbi:MAG: diphthine--ammonia ligase [Conexivisphaerales archaeon]|nr:diphthine--ammonia ligase [Conexivisphaerales archaeon]